MTVYMFVDVDKDNLEVPYDTEVDSPTDLVARLGYDRAFDTIQDTIVGIARAVEAGTDDQVIGDLEWLNLEVYDRDDPESRDC